MDSEKIIKIPDIIFVIGNPCTGKSSFSEMILKNGEYEKIDDFSVLKEIFEGDEIIYNNLNKPYFEKKWNIFLDKTIYTKKIWPNFKDIKGTIYSNPNETGGFNIVDCSVWNLVLEISAKKIKKGKKYIFEFSRGYDKGFSRLYNIKKEDVYKTSFEKIYNSIDKNSIILVLYFKSTLDQRLKRNQERYKNGGNLVSEKGMNEIYKEDFIKTERKNGIEFLTVCNKKFPVYFIENPDLKKEKREAYFLNEYNSSLRYLNDKQL